MSQMRPLIDGWVGYGDGASILLETGTLIDSDHPVVLARPELFESIAPVPVPTAVPPKKVAAKKAAADG
jgi:hypothetical protein